MVSTLDDGSMGEVRGPVAGARWQASLLAHPQPGGQPEALSRGLVWGSQLRVGGAALSGRPRPRALDVA